MGFRGIKSEKDRWPEKRKKGLNTCLSAPALGAGAFSQKEN